MQITKVTRSYSRSINARNYGMPESWVKVEATYEAICESQDNPIEVSKMIFEQAQKEVVDNINAITTKMKEASQRLSNTAATGSSAAPANTTTPPSGTGPRSL